MSAPHAAEPTVRLSFEWSFREDMQAQRAIIVNRVRSEGLDAMFWAGLGLLALIDGFAIWRALKDAPLILDVALPFTLLIGIAIWYFFFGRAWLSAWQQRGSGARHYPISHLFSDHGLRVRGRSAEMSMTWRGIKKIVETPEFFLFYFKPHTAYYLPLRVVAEMDLRALRALIRAHAAGVSSVRS